MVLRVADEACVESHSEHGGDFIAVDGNCGPDACLPPPALDDANGRTCACNPGFTGDAELGCTDVNECAVDNGGCTSSADAIFAVSPRSSVFSSTPTRDGRIDAGVHYDSRPYGFDLPEDFLISHVFHRGNEAANVNGIEVEVPAGARYVLVVMFDDYYADNPATDDDLGVRVTRLASCVNTPGSFHCD